MRVPLYCNATGERVEDPRRVADLLAGQLTRPLRWVDCIGSMARDGIEEFVICGPGKALRGMVRKILGARARIRVVQAVGDLHASKE
jgi:[acyl-carrier-protein] S-malonyltransferase